MITLEPHPLAIRAGWAAMQDFAPCPYEDVERALEGWNVRALLANGVPIGCIAILGDEIHATVMPEVRKKWLSKRILREALDPILKEYGSARTTARESNPEGQEFVERLGFKEVGRREGIIFYELTG